MLVSQGGKMELYEYIAKIKFERKLTLNQIAEGTGLGFQFLAKFLEGKRPKYNHDKLEAFARWLEMSPAELMAKAETEGKGALNTEDFLLECERFDSRLHDFMNKLRKK